MSASEMHRRAGDRTQRDRLELIAGAFVGADRDRADVDREIDPDAGVEGGDRLRDDRELIVPHAGHDPAVAAPRAARRTCSR